MLCQLSSWKTYPLPHSGGLQAWWFLYLTKCVSTHRCSLGTGESHDTRLSAGSLGARGSRTSILTRSSLVQQSKIQLNNLGGDGRMNKSTKGGPLADPLSSSLLRMRGDLLKVVLQLLHWIYKRKQSRKGASAWWFLSLHDVHLQKGQLSPEARHPRDVRSGPVREEDAKSRWVTPACRLQRSITEERCCAPQLLPWFKWLWGKVCRRAEELLLLLLISSAGVLYTHKDERLFAQLLPVKPTQPNYCFIRFWWLRSCVI